MNNCNHTRYGRCNPGMMPSCPEASMDTFPLAMAYVPMQHFSSVYELNEALQYGTIFPELNKPFMGSKGGGRC